MAPEKEPAKKAATDEDDDEDNVPIALSRSKVARSRDAPRKMAAEDKDEDDRLLVAHSKVFKKKPGTPNGSGPVKVKKEEAEEKEEDGKRKSPKEGMITKKKEVKNIVKKKVVENKKVGKMVSKVTTVENGKKKEKKVYDLPGQKHDPPEERDPLRIFYETLYQQLPSSEMAQYWMMEYGLLPLEIAEDVYAKKLKKNPQSRLNSPVKVVSTKKATVSVKTAKQVSAGKTTPKTSAKRKLASTSSDDDDDDFISAKRKPKKQKVSS